MAQKSQCCECALCLCVQSALGSVEYKIEQNKKITSRDNVTIM